jgi:ABC-type cobalamin/Fe3+-siderophores transport system ATPase subunit
LATGVYFLSLSLNNACCFGQKADLNLCDAQGNWKQWTVILGDNGTGKTTETHQYAGMFRCFFQNNPIPPGI